MTEKAEGALLRQATLPLGENINGPVDAALVVAVFGLRPYGCNTMPKSSW